VSRIVFMTSHAQNDEYAVVFLNHSPSSG
jgi:hypothetical protein